MSLDDLERFAGGVHRGTPGEDRDDVAEHRRSRLDPAGARARHGDLGDRRRLDHDRVERPLDRGQWVMGIQEAGKHADAEPAVAALGDPQQLQRQAELLRVGDVVRLDLGDPLIGDVGERDGGAERKPSQDRHLRRGVGPVDVLCGIGLRIAQLLGAAQGVRIGGAGARHLREDEVRRPVDDSEDLGDLGRREALLDHPDHRHHPRHRGLEPKLDPGLARRLRRARLRTGRSAACWRSRRVVPPAAPAARSRAPGRCRRSARRRSRSPPGCVRSHPRFAAASRRSPAAAPRRPRSRRPARRPGR